MCITTKLQQNIVRPHQGNATRHRKAFLFRHNARRNARCQSLPPHGCSKAPHQVRLPATHDCDNAPVRPEPVEELVESPNRRRESPGERVRARTKPPFKSPLSPTSEKDPLALSLKKRLQAPVTHIDILNYQIAHLIRHETAEGHTVVEFLIHTMTGRDRPFTPKKFCIKPADRMAAARELLRRGFGDLGSRRKQSDTTDEANAYDTLHTDLAKRMREYSERGTDTVRFLLEVMSDPDPDLEFTIHHRMSAAQELLRRGWDTNHDNIKPKHLHGLLARQGIPAPIHRPEEDSGPPLNLHRRLRPVRRRTDYEAIAKEIREEEDLEAAALKVRFTLDTGRLGQG